MDTFQAVFQKWKKIARVIGNAEAHILFGLLYILLMWIIAPGVRIFSDPLGLKKPNKPNKPNKQSNFVPWRYPIPDLTNAHEQ